MIGPIKLIRLNLKIIQVINSCSRDEFKHFITEVIKIDGIFRKKRYVWNIVRPKDMYAALAYWIIGQCRALKSITYEEDFREQMNQIEYVIHEILETTPKRNIRQSFIWNIMKGVPLLTAETIQYASEEKIISILRSDKEIIADTHIAPFLKEIANLKNEASAYLAMIDD